MSIREEVIDQIAEMLWAEVAPEEVYNPTKFRVIARGILNIPALKVADLEAKLSEIEEPPNSQAPAAEPFRVGQRRMRTRMLNDGWFKEAE